MPASVQIFPTEGASGDATDISGDPFVTGFADDGGDTPFHAFLFDTETEVFTDLGALSDIGISFGLGVDEFGTVVVGAATVGADGVSPGLDLTHAFRWTEATGMVDLGSGVGPTGSSRALDVSGDGSIIVGQTDLDVTILIGDTEIPVERERAFRWTEAGGFQDLGVLASVESIATAISFDGEVIVGGSGHAFRWTEADGMVDLGVLDGFNFSIAADISDNGMVVVGLSDNSGIRVLNNGEIDPSGASRAFRWTDPDQGGDGMVDLADLLTDTGIDMTGITLISADGLSGDGQYIFGQFITADDIFFDPQPYVVQFADEFADDPSDAILLTADIDGLTETGDGSAETFRGGSSNDQLSGLGGDDVLVGRAGDDFLIGGDGDDRLNGKAGADIMIGGLGDDTYTVDDIDDIVSEAFEDGSRDRINVYVDFLNPINVEFLVGRFSNTGLNLTGNLDRDRITGSSKSTSGDVIRGNGGDDRLVGLGGDDVIEGGVGKDRIFGNREADTITGGAGNDTMNGGKDADVFILAPGDQIDTIKDFEVGLDQLDLSAFGFANFAEVEDLMKEKNGRVQINLDGSDDVVRLNGVLQADLSEGDFILI